MLQFLKLDKPVIVISGINMIEGGILTILKDCLNYLDKNFANDFSIVALVHNKEFFDTKYVQYIEFQPKANWIKRLYLEYYHFNKISKVLRPQLWFSLHDMTPNVQANVQAVYCHNATMFYKPDLTTLRLEPKLVAFSLFYKYLYEINIKQNNYVVVQQKWMREKFKSEFSICNVITSYPDSIRYNNAAENQSLLTDTRETAKQPFKFFYPSFPRVFKNFEVLCEAAQILVEQEVLNIEILITISGIENKYAQSLFGKYKHIPIIKWVGLLSLEEVHILYEQSDVLVFPSKLETWGLPISEFKTYDKPMLVADLPYAHETALGHGKTLFFNPNDAKRLAEAMLEIMRGEVIYTPEKAQNEDKNICYGWGELFNKLLNKSSK